MSQAAHQMYLLQRLILLTVHPEFPLEATFYRFSPDKALIVGTKHGIKAVVNGQPQE